MHRTLNHRRAGVRACRARRRGRFFAALVFGAALFLPAMHSNPAVPWPKFDVEGHRGARGLMPENTLPAFLRALELGVTTLEMDVVISADSQVVVSHDPWFSATFCSLPSGEPVPVEKERSYRLFDMTYDEIVRFDCGSRGHPRFPEQRKMKVAKPLLRDVIAAAEDYVRTHDRPPVWYNIETKSSPEGDGVYHPPPDVFTRLLYEVLDEAGITDRVILQSFDVRTLQYARANELGLRTALLVGQAEDAGLDANLARLGFTPDVYSPDRHLVDAALLEAAHARGMRVIPWTVNDVAEMRRLKALGVEGIITDYPDRARFLLEE